MSNEQTETRELICISCPIGCHLTVTVPEESLKNQTADGISVTGNRCPRGEVYATEEVLAPKRMVTSTVRINARSLNRIPVKTEAAIPVELVDPLLEKLYTITLNPPVKRGDKVVENYADTGVSVVVTRSIED